jgi:hypothetical protein
MIAEGDFFPREGVGGIAGDFFPKGVAKGDFSPEYVGDPGGIRLSSSSVSWSGKFS